MQNWKDDTQATHSRIGDVTAAVTGGLTMAQLHGIGDWKSTAVRFYLCALSAMHLPRWGFNISQGNPDM